MSGIIANRIGANLIRRLVGLDRFMTPTIRCSALNTKSEDVAKSEAGLMLTDSCVKHLKQFSSDEEFLRISVEGGGCSGFSYKFELDKERGEDDLIFSRDGVSVVTDLDSFELIKGSKIDYEIELIKSAFRVVGNPQSTVNCSCGVSFSVDL